MQKQLSLSEQVKLCKSIPKSIDSLLSLVIKEIRLIEQGKLLEIDKIFTAQDEICSKLQEIYDKLQGCSDLKNNPQTQKIFDIARKKNEDLKPLMEKLSILLQSNLKATNIMLEAYKNYAVEDIETNNGYTKDGSKKKNNTAVGESDTSY